VGLMQNTVNQGRLAVVNVRYYRYVPDVLHCSIVL
jgi:hypothetical protein